ncbi:MAG: NADH-quinone oxidoreductase subunit M [Bacteroidia bacterium]|nr:MAG: NADH-quinone oxidoreductase subunit M [Bacteroidia bacterium]
MIGNLLIFVPMLGFLMLLLPSFRDSARRLALFFVGIEFLIALIAYGLNYSSVSDSLLKIDYNWIQAINAHWHLHVTGVSMVLALLNALVFVVIFLSVEKNQYADKPHLFYALGLLMQAAMMGVFLTKDAFSFYIFWELSLIPIYLIGLMWGENGKEKITLKFFLYTFIGSLFMLAGFIYLYHHTALLNEKGIRSWDILDFYQAGKLLTPQQQMVVFWMIFLGFAVKVPIFPFHSWQPDTYTNMPVQGTMMLSGLMLKMGLFGLMFWLVPVVPTAVSEWQNFVLLLSILGVVYASFSALVQTDFKRMLAYASMAHVGLIAAGILSNTRQGMDGAAAQMFAHGVYVTGLFYVVHLFEKHTGTREITKLGGIRNLNGQFSNIFLIILLGSIALPLTHGFVGEFLIITGLTQTSLVWAIIGGMSVILGAVYMLRAYQKMMLGDVVKTNYTFGALEGKDKWSLFLIVFVILFLGIFPQALNIFTSANINGLFAK